MYYWSKNVGKVNLENELISSDKVKEIFIGTAFFSYEGLRILKEIIKKNNLKKNHVHIFISDEFSQNKPHVLLSELCSIAQVKIFFDHPFHSKVYFLKGNENKVIFGSSNFTAGGFEKNIEFDSIEKIEDEKLDEIEGFFRFCDYRATDVTEEVIQYYKDNQAEIEALQKEQKKLKKKIKGFIRQDDAMDLDDYDIEDYYFTFADYETFFKRNEAREDMDIREKRKVVQDKMLAIHEMVYPQIKKLGVNCHWNQKNISSILKPCEYNRGKVGWIGVRYGKTKKEVDAVNEFLGKNEKDEIKGFQKHGCLQFCIVPNGFEINLFLAVRHDAIDRGHVQDNMNQLKSKITKEISKLQGYEMTWEIYNEAVDEYYSFDIDKDDPEDFCKFLFKYDRDGCESYLKIFYPADDEALYDIDSISFEITTYIKMLMPLYNVLVWRPPV